MAITRYNAKDCVITVNGMYITQLGEDMVSWEKEEAYFEPTVGALGDVVKSEVNNDLHTLTLTIQTTSPQLKELMALAGTSESFPVWVVNKSLGVRFGGENANISEAPAFELGSELGDMEFTFTVFDGVTEVN